jgi:hypothetical protein
MSSKQAFSGDQDTVSVKERKLMTTRRVEMERFSMVSPKPFQAFLAALKSGGRASRYGGYQRPKVHEPSLNWKMSFEEDSGKRN